MARESEPYPYSVSYTYRGRKMQFRVDAASGAAAVTEVRRLAKAQGMNRIFVNQVRQLAKIVVEYKPTFATPLTELGGNDLNLNQYRNQAGASRPIDGLCMYIAEINAKIESVWANFAGFVSIPDSPPLKAYELGGRMFLDDGVSGRQELFDRSPFEVALLMYEWATYTGYICDDLDVFVEDYWR